MKPVRVVAISFGYGHAPAPRADITLDVRRHFRNPHHDPAMRYLTGQDQAVRDHVLDTPGVLRLIEDTADLVRNLLNASAATNQVLVAVGCVGGRHRSVAIAEGIAAAVVIGGINAAVSHRDIDREVLPAGTHQRLDNTEQYGQRL
ncbi:RapZ C-terminal domain-containing protein [Saccharopolyspora hattusasensis]|uniref:RapZ C-terminal domain-containing protein n=1 Tax=Saccharopolyspora hattusasensis TaxID=1128679 RepID=UPI003D96C40A